MKPQQKQFTKDVIKTIALTLVVFLAHYLGDFIKLDYAPYWLMAIWYFAFLFLANIIFKEVA